LGAAWASGPVLFAADEFVSPLFLSTQYLLSQKRLRVVLTKICLRVADDWLVPGAVIVIEDDVRVRNLNIGLCNPVQ
jgi:hypothetical protein